MTVVDLTVKVVCKGTLEEDIKQKDFDVMESIFCDKKDIESKIQEYILSASDRYRSDDIFVNVVNAKVLKKHSK